MLINQLKSFANKIKNVTHRSEEEEEGVGRTIWQGPERQDFLK